MGAPTVGQKEHAWSYSALTGFETCPRRYLHYNVLKDVREPETDELREGKRVHEAFEQRVMKNTPLPLGMASHEPMLAKIAAKRDEGAEILGEQRYALTRDFQPSPYFGERVWFRTVVDLGVIYANHAVIFDWKTGKPKQDPTQLLLMSATVFCQMRGIETVTAALVFTKFGHTETVRYRRGELAGMWAGVLPRVRKLEAARSEGAYPPRPSGLCRRYCAVKSCEFHGGGGGRGS